MKKDERRFHSCPYIENTQGFKCALDCNEECPIHPDYEPEEDYSDALNQAYDAGWQQGYKKGYIQAMEDEDGWVDEDEDEDFERYGMGGLEDLEDSPFTWDKPIEWKISDTPHTTLKSYGISEEEHPCEKVRNYEKGFGPCVNCDCDCCPLDDYEEDEEIYEKLFQSGDLEPSVAKAYEIGKNYGYEQGLAEISVAAEENYLEGYKDAITGEPCFIENEEIEKILEDIKERKNYNLSYDTEFLSLVKEIQNDIFKLHKYSDNQEFKRSTYDILHLLTELTQLVVMKPVYDYWVRLEDIED